MGIKRKKLKVGDLVVAKGHYDGGFDDRPPIGLVVALYQDTHAGVRWVVDRPGYAYLTVQFQIYYDQTGFPANDSVDNWVHRKFLRRISKRQA